MRWTTIIIILLLCTTTTLAYQSVDDVPDGYAPPWSVISGVNFFNLSPVGEARKSTVTIEEGGRYVYEKAYLSVDNVDDGAWKEFTFDGATNGWVVDSATHEVPLPVGATEAYVIAYTCEKYLDEWKCGCRTPNDCGMWSVQALEAAPLPPPPETGDDNVTTNTTNATTTNTSDGTLECNLVGCKLFPEEFNPDLCPGAYLNAPDVTPPGQWLTFDPSGVDLQGYEGYRFWFHHVGEDPGLVSYTLCGGECDVDANGEAYNCNSGPQFGEWANRCKIEDGKFMLNLPESLAASGACTYEVELSLENGTQTSNTMHSTTVFNICCDHKTRETCWVNETTQQWWSWDEALSTACTPEATNTGGDDSGDDGGAMSAGGNLLGNT